MRKPAKSDLAKSIEATCEEVHILTSNEGQCVTTSMAFLQCHNKAMFYSLDDLGKIIPTVEWKTLELALLCLSLADIMWLIPPSMFERSRPETIRDGNVAIYKTSGKHTVPNYHKSWRHPGNKATVAESISIYTLETAPKLLNDQSILLAGGFQDGTHVTCAQCRHHWWERPLQFTGRGWYQDAVACNSCHYHSPMCC